MYAKAKDFRSGFGVGLVPLWNDTELIHQAIYRANLHNISEKMIGK